MSHRKDAAPGKPITLAPPDGPVTIEVTDLSLKYPVKDNSSPIDPMEDFDPNGHDLVYEVGYHFSSGGDRLVVSCRRCMSKASVSVDAIARNVYQLSLERWIAGVARGLARNIAENECACGGRGYWEDPESPQDRYCDCPAGKALKKTEATP